MRDIFEPSDRYLIKDLLLMQANSLIQKDNKDLKFDYKMFPFLDRFQFAYKLYLDEALISMRNISRAFMNSLRRGEYRNFFSLSGPQSSLKNTTREILSERRR